MNIIVAMDKNNGIGKNNQLLAYIKPDLKYFKQVTNNNIVIMGYNTYMSLPSNYRPLPNRINIVLTTKNVNLGEDVIIANSLDNLMDKLSILKSSIEHCNKGIFVIGGGSVYNQLLPFSQNLYITHIFDSFDADTYFPEIKECEWEIESTKCNIENIRHQHPHIFTIYKRKH